VDRIATYSTRVFARIQPARKCGVKNHDPLLPRRIGASARTRQSFDSAGPDLITCRCPNTLRPRTSIFARRNAHARSKSSIGLRAFDVRNQRDAATRIARFSYRRCGIFVPVFGCIEFAWFFAFRVFCSGGGGGGGSKHDLPTRMRLYRIAIIAQSLVHWLTTPARSA